MEDWKDILGYEGFYQINTKTFVVRSVERFVKNSNGRICLLRSQIMKEHKNNKGYTFYALSKNGVNRKILSHRLFYENLVGEIPYKMQINHKNGVRDDNRIENLEIVTNQQNVKHRFDVLGRKSSNYQKFGIKSNNHKRVKKIDYFTKDVLFIYDTIREASKAENIPNNCITSCCKGRQKTAGGFLWEYL